MAGRPAITQAPESGARLAALRKTAGLTQAQLAHAAGIPARSISFYERKAQSIPSHLVAKFAKALNVTPDSLLGQTALKATKKRGPISDVEKRMEQIRHLPKSAQRRILSVVDAMLVQESS